MDPPYVVERMHALYYIRALANHESGASSKTLSRKTNRRLKHHHEKHSSVVDIVLSEMHVSIYRFEMAQNLF
jgi:hypothetical protein